MHQRIFREDHVKLAVGKWQAAGLHQPEADPIGQAPRCYKTGRRFDQLLFYIDADDRARAMALYQDKVDATQSLADIENMPS